MNQNRGENYLVTRLISVEADKLKKKIQSERGNQNCFYNILKFHFDRYMFLYAHPIQIIKSNLSKNNDFFHKISYMLPDYIKNINTFSCYKSYTIIIKNWIAINFVRVLHSPNGMTCNFHNPEPVVKALCFVYWVYFHLRIFRLQV